MRKTVTQWLDQLRSPDERAAQRAVLKLGGLEPTDAWMVPDLMTALDDRDPKRRFWALTALGCLARTRSLGNHAAVVTARVTTQARADRAFGNRQAALVVLAMCPRQTKITLPTIVHLAQADRNALVRAEAVRALGTLGRKAASAASMLVSALGDPDDGVRWAASIALKFVPISTSSDAIAIRRTASEHPDESVRDQLSVVLSRLRIETTKRR